MKLTLVKKVDEARDTKSFFFSSDEKIIWEAGQYTYLTLGEITKQFTIASSPTEKFIQVTTRIRSESEFKQNLDKLKIGDQIEARAPFGTFVLLNSKSSILNHVFMAGGIGITPFRSMIKYNIDQKLGIPMCLIYSNSDSEFVFKNELDEWQKENKNLKISYFDSSKSGHLDVIKLSSLLTAYSLEHITAWVVGPPPFVNAMEDVLEELKISEDNIKTEKFTGY
ncbi:MAG: hypothetical protein ACD_19C00079G0048 [uncultured bacterium]|nr:MAG: hypothetical protein ACD_19C00079G0048 [uncultured bacterium]